jgi:hypothetical protein
MIYDDIKVHVTVKHKKAYQNIPKHAITRQNK